jgi:hypothetical protein
MRRSGSSNQPKKKPNRTYGSENPKDALAELKEQREGNNGECDVLGWALQKRMAFPNQHYIDCPRKRNLKYPI